MDKIIVNVASYQRIKSLVQAIESIYNQCDIINVCLNSHSGEIPEILYRDKINLYFTDNSKGDAFKFLNLEESNGYYLTIDDDLIYPPNYVEYVINKCKDHDNKKIITLHGRSFSSFPIVSYYKSATERYACLETVKNDVKVQFGGTGVMCFHTDLLKVSINDFLYPNMADIWIGKFAKERNIDIICVSHSKGYINYIPQSQTIYNTHSSEDKIQTFVANKAYGVNPKCDISIIVPTFKNVKFIDECLKSIENSVKGVSCEILVGIDGCRETFNHFKETNVSPYTYVYYFEKNEGPYSIKNTLAELSNSNVLLFFDSDDIMGENMVNYILSNIDRYVCIKPKMYNFDNETKLQVQNQILHGEGVFAIKKDIFMKMNGFEPWMCAADSDFMARLYKTKPPILHSTSILFSRRIHSTSLTRSNLTGMRSVMRSQYAKISKNKRGHGNPEKLNTRNYTVITDLSFFTDLNMIIRTELFDKKAIAQQSVYSVLNKTPRKVVDKVVREVNEVREISKDAVNSLLNRKINVPTVSTPQPRVPQPVNNITSASSNRDTLQKLFLRKNLNKSDAPYINIGGKLNR